MDPGVSDCLGGVFPNKVSATLEIRACSRNYQCTPAGKINLSIAVSTVTGRFMLKPDPTTRNYILYLLVPSFASSRGCRGREPGSMVNIIQLIIIQCCSNFCFIVTFTALLNCWLILTSCCKTSSEDASLR